MNWKKFLFESPIGWGILAFLVITTLNIFYYLGTKFIKEVTVKKVFNTYQKSSKGLMFEDLAGNTYQVSNSWFLGEFDSMEDWNKLEVGKKFRIGGYGVRVPILGMYPRIYAVKSSN